MPNTRSSYDDEYQTVLAEEAARQYALANPFEGYLPPDEQTYTSNGSPIELSGLREKLIAEKDINPNAYYGAVANELNNIIFNNWRRNKNERNTSFIEDLEKIKEINPNAYYNAKLKDYGSQMGWQIGQNRSDRNASTEEELRKIIPDAIKAGISPDQINSIVGTNLNNANAWNQQRIATDAANGGSGFSFQKDILPGLIFVGGSAAGMYGIDSALAAGAAAGAGGFGLTANSVPSLIGGLEVGAGSALAGTGAGAGAAAVPAGGALASLGSLSWTPPAIGGSAGFLAPTLGADVASTGFGLTAADIPSLASGLELGAAASGGSNLLSNAGDILKGAQVAKGLLGAGKNPLQAQASGMQPQQIQGGRQYAGVDYSPILNLLNIQQTQRNRNSLLG